MKAESDLQIKLSDLFLSNDFPVNDVGIFVGCGASKEAGYPLTWELTKAVLELLAPEEIALINEILSKDGSTLNINNGSPDIETINDLVMKMRVQTGDHKYKKLEEKIISSINNHFDKIKTHDLSLHKSFLSFVKNRSLAIPSDFWIFTTNYDLLFEEAASFEKIPLENGFSGSTLRYFNVESFRTKFGEISGRTFHERKECTVRLVKLHGSLSWHQNDGKFYEGLPINGDKVLILPSRNKVIDTLRSPYDTLFTLSSQVLGEKCKYLLCFGHSFRDDHINKNLIIPKLKAGKLRVMALLKEVTSEVEELSAYSGFGYITEKKSKIGGKVYDVDTDLWKFSSLVNFIQSNQI